MQNYQQDIRQAVAALEAGGVILYPTDTVWGLGCDAANAEAVARIYAIKQRQESKSMLVLVDCPQRMAVYVDTVPDVAWDLMELADKPLTIIYDGARNLAPNLIADDGSIGIRVTAEQFSRDLCARFRRPIVSTSANISGRPTPRTFAEIPDEIRQIPIIISSAIANSPPLQIKGYRRDNDNFRHFQFRNNAALYQVPPRLRNPVGAAVQLAQIRNFHCPHRMLRRITKRNSYSPAAVKTILDYP